MKREKYEPVLKNISYFIKWVEGAIVIGIVSGCIGTAFGKCVLWVLAFFQSHPWMVFLLSLIHILVKQGMMTSLRSKIGALLVKPALKTTLKAFDASQYGGAPLLGLKGLVVKTHGNSKRIEVCNSILQCVTFKEQAINEKIKESL